MIHDNRTDVEFPTDIIFRILKRAGAEKVSDDACIEMSQVLSDIANQIAIDSIKFASARKEKIVQDEDIVLAAKTLCIDDD